MFENIKIPPAEEVTEGRRPFFIALELLRNGSLEASLKAFRRAQRKAEPPFDGLSALGTAECEIALGKLGAARNTLNKIVADSSHPDGLLIGAWRKIATIEEARDNQAGIEQAVAALQRLEDPLLR